MTRPIVVFGLLIWVASAALAQGQQWIGRDLSGSRIEGCNLSSSALVGGQWIAGLFSGVAMQQANMQSCSLQDAVLTDVNFGQARCERIDLTRVEMRASTLNRLTLRDCKGDDLSLTDVTLAGPKLSNARLTDVVWSRGRLSGRLENVELPRLVLTRCSGSELTVDGGDVREVKLGGFSAYRLTVDGLQVSSGSGYFEDLQARSSRWYRVDLDGAQMERVDLRGARLQSCDLSNARLERCDIRGLTINGHNIEELIKKAER